MCWLLRMHLCPRCQQTCYAFVLTASCGDADNSDSGTGGVLPCLPSKPPPAPDLALHCSGIHSSGNDTQGGRSEQDSPTSLCISPGQLCLVATQCQSCTGYHMFVLSAVLLFCCHCKHSSCADHTLRMQTVRHCMVHIAAYFVCDIHYDM